MTTNTFVRKILIADAESLKRLEEIMKAETPKEPISKHLYTQKDRQRAEELLRRCPLYSQKSN